MVNSTGQITSTELKNLNTDEYAASRPVGRYVYSNTSATCWLLGNSGYVIMTIHDVIEQVKVDELDLSAANFQFLTDSAETSSLNIIGGESIKTGTIDVLSEDYSDDDFFVITLDDFDVKYSRLHDIVGGIYLSPQDGSILVDNDVFMPGYPSGSNQLTSYYSLSGDGKRCRVTVTESKKITTDCYSPDGVSGSPVIFSGTAGVVGISLKGYDPAGENVALVGARIWSGVNAFIDDADNIYVKGLSVDNPFKCGQLALIADEQWHSLDTFTGDIFFDEFSGGLSHFDGYTLFSCKARSDTNLEYIVNLNYRISQKTNAGTFSLKEAHGDAGETKELLISYNASDNTEAFVSGSSYRTWVGLEGLASADSSTTGYFIYSVNLTKE